MGPIGQTHIDKDASVLVLAVGLNRDFLTPPQEYYLETDVSCGSLDKSWPLISLTASTLALIFLAYSMVVLDSIDSLILGTDTFRSAPESLPICPIHNFLP